MVLTSILGAAAAGGGPPLPPFAGFVLNQRRSL